MNIKKYLVLGTCLVALGACQTTAETDAAYDRASKIDRVLESAARTAAASGNAEQELAILENRYKRSSDDPMLATEYAQALRHADYLNRASIVLSPFTRDPAAPAYVKNEYTAIQLALGNYTVAEDYAKQVILEDETNFRAFQNLGIALDAQGMQEEAERAYRKGLEYWEGDPTSIMNNLALNLATQGYVDEATEILEKAKAIAPHRMEIERNLRIVKALQETAHWTKKKETPDIDVKPTKKPDMPAVEVEPVEKDVELEPAEDKS